MTKPSDPPGGSVPDQLVMPDAMLKTSDLHEVADILLSGPLVGRYLAAKRDAGLSPKTLKDYGWYLEALAKEHPIVPIDPEVLQAFVRSRGGKATESLKTSYRTVRIFYSWLVKQSLLDVGRDPFLHVERPKGKTPIPRILSVEQMRRVVEISIPPFNRALILTLVDTACRIGELAGRNKDHLAGGMLELFGKTGGRLVPVSPEVSAYLLELPTHYLFPVLPWGGVVRGNVVDRPAQVDTLKGRVRSILKRSGLGGRKLGPHLLRHSAATSWINAGGDLKSLSQVLGHTTTQMTERYVTLALDSLRQKQAQYGVLQAIVGAMPGVPASQLPEVELPEEAVKFPLYIEGVLVRLFMVAARSKYHTFFYINARKAGSSGRSGARKWPVCSLGTDLPVNIADAYRQAIHQENARRAADETLAMLRR